MKFEFILYVAVLVAVVAISLAAKFRRAFLVPEGWVGLLCHKGRFVKGLDAGRHIRWGRHFTIGFVDIRKATLVVAGQEVLTADKVGVKCSLLVTYQVTEPARAVYEHQSWQNEIHNLAQIAVRAVVGGVDAEILLGQRLELGVQLLARVQPEAAKFGVNVLVVEIRDVTLSADLKRAFSDVLKAKQEGQAALERARGESAALRNLANAARVLEGNPALMNLRLLQSLGSAQKSGNTLVLGVPGGFVPLRNGKPTPDAQAEPGDT